MARCLSLLLCECVFAAEPPCPTGLRVEHLHESQATGIDVRAPRFSWFLTHPNRAESQTAYQLQVCKTNATKCWDTQKVVSSESEGITLTLSLTAGRTYNWRVKWWDSTNAPSSWSAFSHFSTGLFEETDWSSAKWLGGTLPSGVQLRSTFQLPASGGTVAAAQLFVVGVGYYKCEINGHPVSDHELGHFSTISQRVLYDTFDVSGSEFSLATGSRNAIACTLGDGPLSKPGRSALPVWHTQKALRLKLSVLFSDGMEAVVITTTTTPKVTTDLRPRESVGAVLLVDTHWHQTRGPYIACSVFGGIVYDARQETPGWTTAYYSPAPAERALWTPAAEAVAMAAPNVGALRAAMTPLIRRTESFRATRFTPLQTHTLHSRSTGDETLSSSYLVDFAQNAAAQLAIAVPALPSTPTSVDSKIAANAGNATYTLRVQCAETLDASKSELGGLLSDGPVIFTYDATSAQRWQGKVWRPAFTYAGFRYCVLNVTAAGGAGVSLPSVTIDTLTSSFTHTDVLAAGNIRFGEGSGAELLNSIQRNTLYTSLSNLQDIPTDCPTRERAGWTGDGQLTAEVTSFNFDMAAFYRKWLRDISDAQDTYRAQCMTEKTCECMSYNCTGEVPPAAPWYLHGFHGNAADPAKGVKGWPGTDPAWGAALTVIAHHMLRWYGDRRAVTEVYGRLKLYMNYLAKLPDVNRTGLLTFNTYADWDRPSGKPAGAHEEAPLHLTDPPIVPIPTKGPRGVPSPLISSYVYIMQLRMVAYIASTLGHAEDAEGFDTRAQKSAATFIRAYLYNSSSQLLFSDRGELPVQAVGSAQALGLKLFDPHSDAFLAPLLNAEERAGVVASLAADVVAKDLHSVAGIVGQQQLFPMCSRHGTQRSAQQSRSGSGSESAPLSPRALALLMNTQTSYPSFGHEVAQGATTLWEKFEGEGGTHNHIMFGTQSAWYFQHLAGIAMAPVGNYHASGQRHPAAGIGNGTASSSGSGWKALVLQPAITCEFNGILGHVNASFVSSRGEVRSSWQILSCPPGGVMPTSAPTPTPTTTCSVVLEKDKYQTNTSGILGLACGPGEAIDQVLFADFGVPLGQCGVTTLARNLSCSSSRTTEVVKRMCLHKTHCSIDVSPKAFGDPCLNVPKRLAVNVTCAKVQPPIPTAPPTPKPTPAPRPLGPRHLQWNISIPVGSHAEVYVPLLGAASTNVTISVDANEGVVTVWEDGSFIGGTVGVSAAKADEEMDSIVLEVGSGAYSFRMLEQQQRRPDNTAVAPPPIKLNNGVEMPRVAISLPKTMPEAKANIKVAYDTNIRQFVTANDYLNQKEVGAGLLALGVPRESYFVTTMTSPCQCSQTVPHCDRNITDLDECTKVTKQEVLYDLLQLNLSYVDLILLHGPNKAADDTGGCNKEVCAANRAQWKAYTELYKAGKVRAIGVGNYCPTCLDCLLQDDAIVPAVNQVQYHVALGADPHGFISYFKSKGIVPQVYEPLAEGKLASNTLCEAIGKKHSPVRSAAQVAMRWVSQNKVLPNMSIFTSSSSKQYLEEDLNDFDWLLSEDEVQELNNVTCLSHPEYCKGSTVGRMTWGCTV